MKRPTEKLLEDLLEESAPPEFRAALMTETLRQARRRRVFRRAGIAAGSVAVALALILALWRPHEPTVARREIRRPDLIVVSTQPLDPSRVVRTQPGLIATVTSSDSSVTVVETRVAERIYVVLDDQQLLALLSGKPVALIHQGPHQAELIFLDPQDEKELLIP
jgi:hypothetical protein